MERGGFGSVAPSPAAGSEQGSPTRLGAELSHRRFGLKETKKSLSDSSSCRELEPVTPVLPQRYCRSLCSCCLRFRSPW